MYEVGGIINGSSFDSNTSIQSIIIKMLGDSTSLDHDTTPPNTRYEVKNLGTWSSIEDVDDFFSTCNHNTNYYGATIGSYVTIKDGIYNKTWVIAGFDMEHNKIAADETVYDNGYGICLIPKNSLGNAIWNSSDTSKGYYGSTMHTSVLPTVANNLKKILGGHLIKRNVLLSNGRDENNYYAYGYEWTTAYCTLMSMGQITGTFKSARNKYDDGEANYKLPLFNYEKWSFDAKAWLRAPWGYNYGIYNKGNLVYCLTTSGGEDKAGPSDKCALRPLIYIK